MEYGYLSVFLISLLAATVIPFSSDIVVGGMVLYGYDPVLTLIMASLGNWAGGMSSYLLGYIGKWEWIEKYLRVKKDKVMKFSNIMHRYGPYTALVSWLPLLGDTLAVALGLFKVSPWKVSLYMLIGKSGRYALIIYLTLKTGEAVGGIGSAG